MLFKNTKSKSQNTKHNQDDQKEAPFKDAVTTMSHKVSFAELLGMNETKLEDLDPENNVNERSFRFFQSFIGQSEDRVKELLSLILTKEELKFADYSTFEAIHPTSPFAVKNKGRIITCCIDFVKPEGRTKKFIGIKF